jgi:hypothetical protein
MIIDEFEIILECDDYIRFQVTTIDRNIEMCCMEEYVYDRKSKSFRWCEEEIKPLLERRMIEYLREKKLERIVK